jgi:uncharacterized protein YbbC (DUF1343 family)
LDGDGTSTVDILHGSARCTLVKILTPEHGFRGTAEHGEEVADSIDVKTGLPVISLYGPTRRPTDQMLRDVDTIVFDIQDVGTRFYTYITTMGMALEEAAKRHIRFVVLDRPNPIRGDILEGDILDPDIKRMTGYFTIPIRHGFTVGELAAWINDAHELKADLHIVQLKKWKRHLWFDQTGLRFTPPSPNIPTLVSALLYSGIGCFEATNVAVGRGTETPFQIFGAPWINGKALAAYLREKNIPGVLFEPVQFSPSDDIYKGEECNGVKIIVTDRNRVRPFRIFVYSFLYLIQTYPNDFKPIWEEIRVVTGSDALRQTAEGYLSPEDLFKQYNEIIESFQNDASAFYLY